MQRSHASRRAIGMCLDAATRHIEQVECVRAPPRLRRLSAPLAGGDHGEQRLAEWLWREARRYRADYRIVRLPEFVGNAVDVELIDAG